MMRHLSLACATMAALALSALSVSAQDRFALVIGNSSYKTVSPLTNPGRDAAAVGALLKDAGFQVTSALDLDKSSMSKVIRFFTTSIAEKPENTVALIYFAGHGVQVDGENYLVPVGANIRDEADVAVEAVAVSYTHLDVYKRQPRELAVRLRHHGGPAFLAADDGADAVAVIEAVERREIALARHAKDRLDALRLERLSQNAATVAHGMPF